MINFDNKGFTLVELIVVITILVILWTIWLISLQWFSKDARDWKRVSELNNIRKSLELYKIKNMSYPMPDNGEDMVYSWSLLWTQWVIWSWVIKQLSKNIVKKPLDPLLWTEYIYSITHNGLEYEILWLYEWDLISKNNLLYNKAFANIDLKAKVDWNYNWIYVKTSDYVIPTPSIITSLDLPNEINQDTINSQVVTWYTNLPSYGDVLSKTWGLNITNFDIYSWNLDKDVSDQDLLDLYNIIANTYSGTLLEKNNNIFNLLSQNTYENKINYIKNTVINKKSWTLSNWSSTISYTSCLDAKNKWNDISWKYLINPDGWEPVNAYCDMVTDGWWWTLVLKADGSKETFIYDSNYWTTNNVLNKDYYIYDNTEFKSDLFNRLPFNNIYLELETWNNKNAVKLSYSSNNLLSIFNGDNYINYSYWKSNWMSLVPGSSLQPYCNNEWFNAYASTWLRARIGITSNNENDCTSNDSVVWIWLNQRRDYFSTVWNNCWSTLCSWWNKEINSFWYIFIR